MRVIDAMDVGMRSLSWKTFTQAVWRLAVVACFCLTCGRAQADTREQWIELGARIHGAFGAFIPVGIRIGLDAQARLKAAPRRLAVMFANGNAPCPCVADGIMLATGASPGQGTLQIAADKAPAGLMANIVIRNRDTNEALHYTIAGGWLPKILAWNKLDLPGRYDAAMAADDLFQVEPPK